MATSSGTAARAEPGPAEAGGRSGASPLGTGGAVSGISRSCVAERGSVSWLVTRGSDAGRGSKSEGTGAERHRGAGAGIGAVFRAGVSAGAAAGAPGRDGRGGAVPFARVSSVSAESAAGAGWKNRFMSRCFASVSLLSLASFGLLTAFPPEPSLSLASFSPPTEGSSFATDRERAGSGGARCAWREKNARNPATDSSKSAHFRVAGLSHLGRFRTSAPFAPCAYLSSTNNTAPWSFLCRKHRPTAWLSARNACCEYHWSPDKTPARFLACFSSLYLRLSSTCLSLRLG